MKVWVYSNIRNEILRLPYWIRHYQGFADRIIVYDDNSDDGSLEMMIDAGIEVRPCPWSGIDDIIYPIFASEQYKEARGIADWVMWVDGDEFIYHPNMQQRLDELSRQGVTLPYVDGYAMFSDGPPTGSGNIYDEINTGVPDDRYCKPVVLNPSVEIRWGAGRHDVSTIQHVNRDNDGQEHLKLLHYRWFGRDEFIERNARIWESISADNIRHGLGLNSAPGATEGHHTLTWYENLLAQAKPCL